MNEWLVITLDDGQLERLAKLVAENFRAATTREERLIDVAAVADYLGVDPA